MGILNTSPKPDDKPKAWGTVGADRDLAARNKNGGERSGSLGTDRDTNYGNDAHGNPPPKK